MINTLDNYVVLSDESLISNNQNTINGIWYGYRDTIQNPPTIKGTAIVENNLEIFNRTIIQCVFINAYLNSFQATQGKTLMLDNPNFTFTAQPDINGVTVYTIDPSVPEKTQITLSDTITFQGTSIDIFIIKTAGIQFNNCNFIMGNVLPSNVFWQADASDPTNETPANFDFNGTNIDIYGIFITNGHGDNPNPPNFCNINVNGPLHLGGRLYTLNGSIYFNSSNIIINGTNEEPVPVCYAKGTLILTKNGFIPIEQIKLKDNILTNGLIYNNKNTQIHEKYKFEHVVWISSFKVNKLSNKSRPICIKKNAFGKSSPITNLYVSPNHGIIINNKLIRAKDLINGTTIFRDHTYHSIEYYHIELDRHSVINANGVWSESYLDTNNRSLFKNSQKIQKKIELNKLCFH
jgi:hypothetical protein